MDSSCATYSQLITDGMNNAFDLAEAGFDTFGITSLGSGAKWQARKDLISYMFSEALTDGKIDTGNTNWQLAESTLTSVLTYKSNSGEPDAAPDPGNYRLLKSNTVIVYCDYSRFKEGQDCDGVKRKGMTCDTSIGISVRAESVYEDCKSSGFFSTTQLSVCTGTRSGVITDFRH